MAKTYTFKDYADYESQRDAAMENAKKLAAEGKKEEFEAVKEEIEAMDAGWDAKAEADADLNALEGNKRIANLTDIAGVEVKEGIATGRVAFVDQLDLKDDEKKLHASEEYRAAWAKLMMNKALSSEEKALIQNVNKNVHTTENTGVLIPVTTSSNILDAIEEMYPFWADVSKTYVKGGYTVLIGNESSDAAWYDEETETEDGKGDISGLALSGCELSRAVTVSWKLKEMAVEDFIPYVERRLARKMGAGLGYGVTHGKGKPATGETFKPEPTGVVTALTTEKDTTQVLNYKKGNLSYKNLTNARALVKIGANDLAIYANSTTIWGELANVVDENGKPLFIPDPTASGVYRVLGMVVKQDDSMKDGEVLMSSAFVGYAANIDKDITVATDDHVKKRQTDYCGYAIVDGGVTYIKAHALLQYETETGSTTGE
ncbi:MAG: phage major capsid protein [Lachnospiraceae bacterium]|nr:phage major capsid protein [Lachnospiraceae bacterium]